MMNSLKRIAACGMAFSLLTAGYARCEDWTMWGRTPDRNMITPEKGIPTEWDVEKGTNIKWVAKLGSLSYGNPIIHNGMVFIGTNNEEHRDKSFVKDAGVLMAFGEKDGAFLWQRLTPKLPSGLVND